MPFKFVSKLFTPCMKYQASNVSFLTISMTAFTIHNMTVLFTQVYHDEQAYKSGKTHKRIIDYQKSLRV